MPQHLIDIHSHVLYGVDDGAKELEESAAMLRMMYDEGIREAILTPHYHRGHVKADSTVWRRHFDELCEYVRNDKKAGAVKLHLGCELYYYPSATEWLEEGLVLPLAGSRFVLLEFGYKADKRSILEGVQNIIREGYIPVLAHVERYEGLGADTENVRALAEAGAYIQVNSESVGFGLWGAKAFVTRLLKEGLVHFVATDAHDTKTRAPKLAKAAEHIKKHYGSKYCRQIFYENCAAITGE